MYVAGSATVPLCLLTDYRNKSDGQLDAAEAGVHVLDWYKLAREALGSATYAQLKRLALFDYRAEPTSAERASARARLAKLLPAVTVLLPTSQADDDGEAQKASTLSWDAFHAPDSLTEMRGTFYEWAPGKYVMPAFPHSPYLKQLQYWQQEQWLRRAFDVARGRTQLLTCAHKYTSVDLKMYEVLGRLEREALAVDIESIEGTGTMTAIGLSDGVHGVSVPWDSYIPYGRSEREPALLDYGTRGRFIAARVARLLAASTPKVFHNHTFDVPRLQAKGLPIGGPIHDTFAAHGIAYPELRHGLQHACASLLPVRPWKSAWHPKLRGITRDDIEFWICDPLALRDYNADDAFHTWHLAKVLLPHVGVRGVFR